jgi:hypothetical protein
MSLGIRPGPGFVSFSYGQFEILTSLTRDSTRRNQFPRHPDDVSCKRCTIFLNRHTIWERHFSKCLLCEFWEVAQ